MNYVEAVDEYVFPTSYDNKSLFLAGGITGCSDWQAEMVEKLSDTDLTLLNPRRKDFPINDPSAAREQITWEWHHLQSAKAISFWFAKETIQPIVLFELGKWLCHGKRIFIGIDPEYPRRQDVEIQTELELRIEIAYSIDDLVDQIKDSKL
jgi:hypothetical protein